MGEGGLMDQQKLKQQFKQKQLLGGVIKPINNIVENNSEKELSAYEKEVIGNKQLRKDTDEIIQRIKDLPASRERALAITKLQEGVMWLGMDLKRLGEANPYPSSKNPDTGTKIEPTADGLTL